MEHLTRIGGAAADPKARSLVVTGVVAFLGYGACCALSLSIRID